MRLCSMGDERWAFSQLSLSLCDRKPTHALTVQINGEGRPFQWYRSGQMPKCRKVEGPSGKPLVSFAVAQDCGDCDSCRPPHPLTTYRMFEGSK